MCVVDTRGVLGGLHSATHPSLGFVRRIIPQSPEKQSVALIDLVTNHSCNTLIVDDVSSDVDIAALQAVRFRSVQVVCGSPVRGGIEKVLKAHPDVPKVFDLIVDVLSPYVFRVFNLETRSVQLRTRVRYVVFCRFLLSVSYSVQRLNVHCGGRGSNSTPAQQSLV